MPTLTHESAAGSKVVVLGLEPEHTHEEEARALLQELQVVSAGAW